MPNELYTVVKRQCPFFGDFTKQTSCELVAYGAHDVIGKFCWPTTSITSGVFVNRPVDNPVITELHSLHDMDALPMILEKSQAQYCTVFSWVSARTRSFRGQRNPCFHETDTDWSKNKRRILCLCVKYCKRGDGDSVSCTF